MPTCPHTDTLYSRLFARMYDPFMSGIENDFLEDIRQELLRDVEGTVLEVGAGTGANFHHYSAGAEVLAIEPSAYMLNYARRRLQQGVSEARIELLEAALEDRAVRQAAPTEGFDYIVCTLVLCSTPDLKASIDQIRRLLKPGGRLLAIEHVQDKRQPHRWLQSAATSVWKHVSEGCHLDRPTDDLLKAEGFRAVRETYIHRWVPFYWGILE